MLARDPMSFLSIIAWLESRDPDETYSFFSCDDCLGARYVQSFYGPWRGGPGHHLFSDLHISEPHRYILSGGYYFSSGPYHSWQKHWTVKAALKRAREMELAARS